MKALAPLFLELRIRYYRCGLKQLQRRDPTHPDIPDIVRHLHELEAQRPRVEKRPRSRCADLPGMCAGDPNCEDHRCAGRTWGLYQRDGGMEVRGPLSFPIERKRTGAMP